MTDVKLLDCTLRDGGYINDWNFGKNCILDVLRSLESSNIDIIECGFLSNSDKTEDKTLFNTILDIKPFISEKSKYALMLNFGTVDIDNIYFDNSFDFELRIALKKHHLDQIAQFCNKLDEKGIKYSLNPMHTSLYSESELDTLINITNSLNPTCMTVVDTMGVMRESDTAELFKILNKQISKNIPLGFHSHNNLELSYSNIETLLGLNMERVIIIDTALSGIGRGGGMPKTEEISRLINNKCGNNYAAEIIDAVSDKHIKEIALPDKNYKYMYKLSAENFCHPNYAHYLIDHAILSADTADLLFSQVPPKHKMIYNPKIIENIVKNTLTNVTV